MKRRDLFKSTALTSALLMLPKKSLATSDARAQGLPKQWTDTISNKQIIRLSDTENSKSLYFNHNAFTHDSRYMVMNTPKGIALYDFYAHVLSTLIEGRFEVIMVSRKQSLCYARKYSGEFKGKDNGNRFKQVAYYAIDIPSGKATWIGVFDKGFITAVNADDTLMAGAYATRQVELQPGKKIANTDGGYHAVGKDGKPLSFAAAKEVRMADRLAQRVPMELFTINIKTGERRVITSSTDWLNHVQFSPADPYQLMYCHEGPWHMVDRMWTIDIDGNNQRSVHQRMMNMEIAGHEFFSGDGRIIYYDLQTPRGEDFWFASFNQDSGQRVWYHLQRDEWSVHFQVSRDGKLFAGDGGDADMVARATNAKYIYLFEPEIIEDLGVSAPNADKLIRPGRLNSRILVDMRHHDYRVEPNIHFSPDNKYLVFRSNMHGPIHTYAVLL